MLALLLFDRAKVCVMNNSQCLVDSWSVAMGMATGVMLTNNSNHLLLKRKRQVDTKAFKEHVNSFYFRSSLPFVLMIML